MPASRARTAICSAPLEWPSRPGLPTRKVRRRPSLRDTRSTSAADVVEPVDVVAHGTADPGRRAVFAERLAQRPAPFAGGDAGLGAGDRGRHDVAWPAVAARLSSFERGLHTALSSRAARQALQPLDLVALGFRRHGQDGFDAAGQRRRLGFEELVDADHDLLAALDRLEPRACWIRPAAASCSRSRPRRRRRPSRRCA